MTSGKKGKNDHFWCYPQSEAKMKNSLGMFNTLKIHWFIPKGK